VTLADRAYAFKPYVNRFIDEKAAGTDAMHAIHRPNLLAIGVLAFCLTVWAVSFVAVSKTAHIYTHKSSAGFRHDLMTHIQVRWHELKRLVGATTPTLNSASSPHGGPNDPSRLAVTDPP